MTQARVLAEAGRGDNWLVNGGNFESQHFSSLTNITDQNVSGLGLAWALPIDSRMGLSAEPIVVDGVIYLGAPFDRVYAIDAVTAKVRWQFDPHIRIDGPWRNSYRGAEESRRRGVEWQGVCRHRRLSHGGDRCCFRQAGMGDDRLRSGSDRDYRSAPCGRWQGVHRLGGHGYDVRGGVVALDAETGKKAWTFWTTPGDPSKPYESKTMEAAAKTWVGESWKLGGANVWTAITYDAVTNLLLLGTSTTGEDVGDFTGIKSGGSRLFANSVVAVNASTGEYVWHYQTNTPPNGAEEFHILVANLAVDGKEQRVVMTVPRNGVFYTLDVRTGRALLPPRGIDGTAVTALPQIDLSAVPASASSAPVRTYSGTAPDEIAPLARGEAVRNNANGPLTALGHAWFPMSYDTRAGLVYIPAYETVRQGSGALAHGKLVAYDPIKQASRWVVTLPLSVNGGALGTAGNLVFHGDASGDFSAYAADTGKRIWSVKTGSAIQSVPVTYVVNGEQYVLMPIGLGGGFRLFGRVSDMATLETKRGPAELLAFKLGGKAPMPRIYAYIPPVPEPPQQTASAEKIQQGQRVYNKFFCQKCHSPEADGSGAWALDGEVPDLRYMPLSVHRRFDAIVLGGSNQKRGMPKYGSAPGWPWINTGMTKEEADALHAYYSMCSGRHTKKGPAHTRTRNKRA